MPSWRLLARRRRPGVEKARQPKIRMPRSDLLLNAVCVSTCKWESICVDPWCWIGISLVDRTCSFQATAVVCKCRDPGPNYFYEGHGQRLKRSFRTNFHSFGVPVGAVLICRQQVMLCSFAIAAVNLGQSSNGNGREEKEFKSQLIESEIGKTLYTVLLGVNQCSHMTSSVYVFKSCQACLLLHEGSCGSKCAPLAGVQAVVIDSRSKSILWNWSRSCAMILHVAEPVPSPVINCPCLWDFKSMVSQPEVSTVEPLSRPQVKNRSQKQCEKLEV